MDERFKTLIKAIETQDFSSQPIRQQAIRAYAQYIRYFFKVFANKHDDSVWVDYKESLFNLGLILYLDNQLDLN